MEDLPEVYAQIFPEAFSSLMAAPEVFATCRNCAMACSIPSEEKPYSPQLKCCTYYPSLPNYLVGSLLALEPDGEGAKRVANAIDAGVGVSPAGLLVPKLYMAIYGHARQLSFGKADALLCPYYVKEGGLCAIWRSREAVCSTYFCKTIAGNAGRAFWAALRSYLEHVQTSLVKHVLLVLDMPNVAALFAEVTLNHQAVKLSPYDLDRRVDDRAYAENWGKWRGREADFYREAFRLVSNLSRSEFESLCGVEGRVQLQKTLRARDEADRIPRLLRRISAPLPKTDDGGSYLVRLQQSGTHYEVPVLVLDAFDGSMATETIRQRMLVENNIQILEESIVTLFRSGILRQVSD